MPPRSPLGYGPVIKISVLGHHSFKNGFKTELFCLLQLDTLTKKLFVSEIRKNLLLFTSTKSVKVMIKTKLWESFSMGDGAGEGWALGAVAPPLFIANIL